MYHTVETEDGSVSIFSDEFDQMMHAREGAYEESLIKHLYPSGILKLEKENVHILDIGFGAGYNALAAISEFSKMRTGKVNIISLEKDTSAYDCMSQIHFTDGKEELYSRIKAGFRNGLIEDDYFSLKIIFGDARASLQKLSADGVLFDAVFQDPFSPGKNPELWSLDYFRILSALMNEKAVLTTYSAARHVRRAMIESGLRIGRLHDGKNPKEGTLASKSPTFEVLTADEISLIMGDIKSTPYRDPDMDSSRQSILEGRIERMRQVRLKKIV